MTLLCVRIRCSQALDAAGEYWRDPSTSRVYWLPPVGALPTEASIAVASLLLSIEDCARVSVSLVGFSGADTAIQIANSSDATVTSCVFEGFGSTAVNAHFAMNANVSIARNVIAHTGSFSVWINGGGAPLALSGCGAEDNVVLNFGRLGFAFNPAIGIDGVGTFVRRNLIAGGPACGIMFSGALQAVELNIVMDALRSTFDMGVVCTGPRDWTQSGNVLRYNALLRNGYTPLVANNVSDPMRNGVYLDYGNFGHTVVGNLVWQPPHPDTPTSLTDSRELVSWAVYNHGGRNSEVYGVRVLRCPAARVCTLAVGPCSGRSEQHAAGRKWYFGERCRA